MNRRSEESQVPPAKPSDCPSDDALAALVEGVLEADDVARIDEHVDGCEACQALLSAYARGFLESRAVYASTVPDADRASELQRAAGLAAGTRVGRYVVLERVGAGASGVVYAAHDPELDRKVAIKVLHRSIAEQDGHERLLKEARAMAKLAHPNVVGVYDVGGFDGHVFVAMESGAARCAGGWTTCTRPTRSCRRSSTRGAGSRPRTARGSFTAISSPKTCSWARTGACA